MMNPFPHIRSAVRYEWCDVLLDRFYTVEHCADLPLTDIHQDIARRITFGWGFAIALGVHTLIWLFLILPNLPDPVAVALAVVMLPLSLIGGALIAVGYLAICLIRIAKQTSGGPTDDDEG